MITFGTNILHTLKANHPHFIVDGLFRVDVFFSERLVLNELESLEANFYATSEKDEANVNNFLKLYWETKIHNSVADACSRNV